mmetsp:Transcript_89414/g.278219  ORF Transcript_89414/g.278219 Transcript_89414/m.278219 type:complete len:236 (+) Transcript_89414:969-1676(+)
MVARHDPANLLRVHVLGEEPYDDVNGRPPGSDDAIVRGGHQDGRQVIGRHNEGTESNFKGGRLRGWHLDTRQSRLNDLAGRRDLPNQIGIYQRLHLVVPERAHREELDAPGVHQGVHDIAIVGKELVGRREVAVLAAVARLLEWLRADTVVGTLTVKLREAVGIVPMAAGLVTVVDNGNLYCALGVLYALQHRVDEGESPGAGADDQIVALEHRHAPRLGHARHCNLQEMMLRLA